MVAMTTLQRCLTSAPILCYPDTTKTFILDTDASGFGMGAVLSQIHDNQEHVVAYYSKILSKPERQYCVTRRELLAIVQSVKHFHHYLYGTQFLVRTDHGALNWLLNFKNPEGQMARWLEVLASYHFTIQHRPGRQHNNADGLSRRPCEPCNYCSRHEEKDNQATNKDEIEHLRINKITKEPEIMDTEEQDTEESEESHDWIKKRSLEEISEHQQKDEVLGILWAMKNEDTEKPKWEQIPAQSQSLKVY